MRLRDLPEAALVHATDVGWAPVDTVDGANAVLFDCPCGQHVNLIAFEPTINAPLSPSGLSSNGGRWKRESGTTLGDLTLAPSIAVKSAPGVECWHGYIRNGEVT